MFNPSNNIEVFGDTCCCVCRVHMYSLYFAHPSLVLMTKATLAVRLRAVVAAMAAQVAVVVAK